MEWSDIVFIISIVLTISTLLVGIKEINRKSRVDCNTLMTREYENKSQEYKEHMSRLPFEVLYYYNYGRMEYCIDHGKLLD